MIDTIVVFSGIGTFQQATVLNQAAEYYKRRTAEVRERCVDKARLVVADMLGDVLAGYGGSLPEGEVRLDELPEELRVSAERSMIGSWRAGGWASEEEATLALSKVEHITLRPVIVLYVLEDAPASGLPGSHRGTYSGIALYIGP